MIEILFWLADGSTARESITPAMCDRVIAQSTAAMETGGWVGTQTEDGEILVVRISCGGHDVVLALPPAKGICDIGETS